MSYSPATLKFVGFKDLRDIPEPQMLVQDIIPTEGIIALSADPNIGKTFLMIEMARAIGTGTPFLGRFKTRKGAVLFMGQDASILDYARQARKVLGKQYAEIEGMLDATREDLGGDHPLLVNPFDDLIRFVLQPNFYFEDKGHINALIEMVNSFEHTHLERKQIVRHNDDKGWEVSILDEHRTGFDLIVFDTFAAMKMLDENDNSQMQIVMNNIRTLADSTGAAIVFAHHHDKAFERLRGASVILASADVHLELKRKKEWREGEARFVRTQATLKKFRGLKIEPFDYELRTTEQEATMVHQNTPPPVTKETRTSDTDDAEIPYERAEGAWNRMLAASERGSWLPVRTMYAHVGTLGSVPSRTLQRWGQKYRNALVAKGYIQVDKQAFLLTPKGRQAKEFALDTPEGKE